MPESPQTPTDPRVGPAGPRGDDSPSGAAWAGPSAGVVEVIKPPFAQFTVWGSLTPAGGLVEVECRLCRWRYSTRRTELLDLVVDVFEHYFHCAD